MKSDQSSYHGYGPLSTRLRCYSRSRSVWNRVPDGTRGRTKPGQWEAAQRVDETGASWRQNGSDTEENQREEGWRRRDPMDGGGRSGRGNDETMTGGDPVGDMRQERRQGRLTRSDMPGRSDDPDSRQAHRTSPVGSSPVDKSSLSERQRRSKQQEDSLMDRRSSYHMARVEKAYSWSRGLRKDGGQRGSRESRAGEGAEGRDL